MHHDFACTFPVFSYLCPSPFLLLAVGMLEPSEVTLWETVCVRETSIALMLYHSEYRRKCLQI